MTNPGSLTMGFAGADPRQRTKGKLHCPLPIWNTFILVPPDFRVAANPLKAILSLLLRFFWRCVITHFDVNGFGNASGIIHLLCFASFDFSFLLQWFRPIFQGINITGLVAKLILFVR